MDNDTTGLAVYDDEIDLRVRQPGSLRVALCQGIELVVRVLPAKPRGLPKFLRPPHLVIVSLHAYEP